MIFAVAGSGKTTHIISQLNLIDNALIVTYTNNNVENIRDAVIKKWGYFPKNIKLLSYFSFLHSFCYKPFLGGKFKTKGIYFSSNKNFSAKGIDRYISKGNRLFSNRISKLIEEENILEDVKNRLSKYYTSLYIDEIQDFAGHDFNLLKSLAKSTINILMVGDFYQHTFDTSRDGSVNSTLHSDINKYQKSFSEMGVSIDKTTLSKSYRCSPTICKFISDKLGIFIESHREEPVKIRLIETKSEALLILGNNEIVKLFYQKHYEFNCNSRNWGDCKGENKYNDICVVLNDKTYNHFIKDKLHELAAQTRNKLYVACSRARGNLYFIHEKLLK
ncbi:MAG: UvrD-helicase domain-containing protein [Cyclobacteriaceae bacterium]|nr:UvrD-helicase domain-containing protein [Cytophagales bacterium]MCZ8329307.1 UvrD-helicase domain-containing protein [Cyclobacteriaceae bacterium]